MTRFRYIILILVVCLSTLGGCVSVAAYQKMHLNDPEMDLKSRSIETYEMSTESYREGASGGNGGTTGGGCGCN